MDVRWNDVRRNCIERCPLFEARHDRKTQSAPPGARFTWPLERRESVCQPHRLTRCRFRRGDRRSRLTQTPNMPKPAGEAGHEHPAEPGNGVDIDNPTIHQLRPVSQEPFLATGMLVPASDRRGLGQTEESLSHAYR